SSAAGWRRRSPRSPGAGRRSSRPELPGRDATPGHRATSISVMVRRLLLGVLSLLLAAAIWLPVLHLAFAPASAGLAPAEGISPFARALAARQLELWTRPDLREAEVARMRRSNAEW